MKTKKIKIRWFQVCDQVCDLTISVNSKIAGALKCVFSQLHSHPQLQVLLHWLIIISHGLLINVFGFPHAHSNSPYFSKVKFMILFSSLPFSLNGEGCLVKNALGTISIVEQLVQHKHDFVLTAGQGLGICCSGTQTAVRKQDKGRREHLSKLTL